MISQYGSTTASCRSEYEWTRDPVETSDFTTDPPEQTSGTYCSDVAKSIAAPILHVNGDNPEAVCHALEIAADFRARFALDVVVDIVCYRRYGHNEVDQPKFTQPLLELYAVLVPGLSARVSAHPHTRVSTIPSGRSLSAGRRTV